MFNAIEKRKRQIDTLRTFNDRYVINVKQINLLILIFYHF